MGASLDTPARCPLCNELTRDPVTLKCKHHFCQRCIGDLWSVSPAGPYRCPEFRCKTVYQKLPFDGRLVPPERRSSAGTSDNNGQTPFDSLLRRPSLTRLLGKRKASTPVSEQPEAKRSVGDSPGERSSNSEEPVISLVNEPQQSADVDTPKNKESAVLERSDSRSSGESSDSKVLPSGDGDAPQDVSAQIREREEEEVISLDESDSSNEVDICEAPLLATPKKDSQVAAAHASPKKPSSAVNCDSSPGVSNSGRDATPVYTFPKTPATPSRSPSNAGVSSRPEMKSSPVPCHYCPKIGCQSAVKTCLVCGASMCKEHLRPHLDSPVFQNHTLVSPMEDISLWRCQEHQEMNRIYCRQCGVCVCTVCTVIGSHRDHACISIREAERDLRGNLKDKITQLQEAEEKVKSRVTEFKHKKETFTVVLSEAQAGVKQQYAAIREALEQEEQSALQCVTKEESRVLGGLEEKLSHLQTSLQSIQKGLHTLEGLADAKGDKRIQDQAFIIEYTKIADLTSGIGNSVEHFETPEEVDRPRLKCLQRWTEKRLDTIVFTMPGKDRDLYRLLYGTIPYLDADTAHPKLQLSDDNRKVTYSDVQQAYAEHEARFTSFPQVLASRALEGGRWYWEASVPVDDGRWKVGLCEGQMERKGQKDTSRLGFNGSSWCVSCDKRKVEALHNKASVPLNADGLQSLGVFLDYQEGVLSFFNVTPGGSLALMQSYKHRFSGPLYPAFSVSKTQLEICDLFQS